MAMATDRTAESAALLDAERQAHADTRTNRNAQIDALQLERQAWHAERAANEKAKKEAVEAAVSSALADAAKRHEAIVERMKAEHERACAVLIAEPKEVREFRAEAAKKRQELTEWEREMQRKLVGG